MIPERQLIVAVAIALGIIVFVSNLVYHRRLKEEYSWLWLLISVFLLVLAFNNSILKWFTQLIGATEDVSTLFLGAILFLFMLCVQFSIVISAQSTNLKKLTQEVALLRNELEKISNKQRI